MLPVNLIKIFFMSMLPVWELRGSIIVSQAFNPPVPIAAAIAVCMAGNLIPVPFIYFFARRFLEWGKDKKRIGKPCAWILSKGEKAGDKLGRNGAGLFIAVMLFVGIPVPGTGAWTGTLAASMLNMSFKKTILAVLCGLGMAATIMMILSVVGFSFFR